MAGPGVAASLTPGLWPARLRRRWQQSAASQGEAPGSGPVRDEVFLSGVTPSHITCLQGTVPASPNWHICSLSQLAEETHGTKLVSISSEWLVCYSALAYRTRGPISDRLVGDAGNQ